MGDWYIDINGLSRHEGGSGYYTKLVSVDPESTDGLGLPRTIKQKHQYREQNPGIGVRYEIQEGPWKNFAALGEYLNSFNRQTNYVGAGALYRVAGGEIGPHAYLGAMAGGMTGYKDGIMPAIMPMLQLGYGPANLNLMYAPKTADNTGVYMLNMSYRIK